jgi:hypothetical protein
MTLRSLRGPIRPSGRLLGWSNVAVAAAFLLLAVPGCDEDPLNLPPDRTGVIHGRIHDGGGLEPDDIRIQVESPPGVTPRVRISAHPDDDGRFWLAVPEGPVFVSVDGPFPNDLYWRADGLTPYADDAERIAVAGGVRECDVACGRVSAHVGLPPGSTAGPWEVSLRRTDDLSCAVAQRTLEATEDIDVDFSLVPPGRYFLRIRSPQQCAVFAPATFDTAAAEVITVRADELTQHESAILEVASLSGTVTGSWQVLEFEPPAVDVFCRDLQVAGSRTDAEGAFSIPLLAGGAFRLRVTIGGVRRWVGGDDLESATLFTLDPGQAVTGISHVESGLVCEFPAGGPVPLEAYDVVLRSPTGVIYDGYCWTGALRLANLVPGEVFLWVDDWGMSDVWFPQYYDRRETLAAADPIVIPDAGHVAHVTLTLVQGARVFGRLLDAQGRPLNTHFMSLLVYGAADSAYVLNVYTNYDFGGPLYDESNGDYVLTQLRDGQYRMRASTGDTPWTWWPGRACWDSASVFTIENGADLHGLDWRLSN